MPAIINNCSILTQIISPYITDGVMIVKHQNGYGYKVYDNNVLVFCLRGHHIEEFIYGDWTSKLSREVHRIRSIKGVLDFE